MTHPASRRACRGVVAGGGGAYTVAIPPHACESVSVKVIAMKHRRVVLLTAALLLVASASLALFRPASPGMGMTSAAAKFVQSLSEVQRSKAVMAYDAPERTDWHYIPKPTRKGLQVKEMNDAQRQAAFDLLSSALSEAGYGKARKIMQLEAILRELEKSRTGAPLRDPERYFFTLFGQPTADGRWGLSVEGHHLSLNFVVNGSRLVSSTPTFLGANPGELKADYGEGFPKGLRVLAKEEQLAYDLLAALTPEQRKQAIIADKAPNDVRGAGQASPPSSPAVGLAASKMTPAQQTILKALISEYAHTLPEQVAAERLEAVEQAGFDKVTFCWAGTPEPGAGHDYRVQGPTFLIEFNNTQPDSAGNLANHIHCTWHNLGGNFDLPAKQ